MIAAWVVAAVLAAEPSVAQNPPDAVVGQAESYVEKKMAAVRQLPADPRARLELGIAYYEADEYEFALSELVEAIKLNPDNLENLSGRANFHIGNVLLALDRASLAVDAYREALRLGWRQADVYVALGEALTSLGKFDDAMLQYREALEVSPTAFEAYAGLGLALEAAGRVDEAIAQYEQYLRSVPPTDEHGAEAIKGRLAKLKERRRM